MSSRVVNTKSLATRSPDTILLLSWPSSPPPHQHVCLNTSCWWEALSMSRREARWCLGYAWLNSPYLSLCCCSASLPPPRSHHVPPTPSLKTAAAALVIIKFLTASKRVHKKTSMYGIFFSLMPQFSSYWNERGEKDIFVCRDLHALTPFSLSFLTRRH